MNEGLHIVRVDSGDRASGMSVINHTFISGTYADALDRVLSTITKVHDAEKMTSKH